MNNSAARWSPAAVLVDDRRPAEVPIQITSVLSRSPARRGRRSEPPRTPAHRRDETVLELLEIVLGRVSQVMLGPFTVETNRTPDSTSRRARRCDCPQRVLAVPGADRVGSFVKSKASAWELAVTSEIARSCWVHRQFRSASARVGRPAASAGQVPRELLSLGEARPGSSSGGPCWGPWNRCGRPDRR